MAVTAAELNVIFTSSGANKVKGEIQGVDGAIKAAGAGFNNLYESVSSFASRAAASIQNLSGALGKIGLTAVTAIFGKGAKMAWDQVGAVEQATVALRAYEKDASKVDKVLQDLVAHARSREGKLFMREDLFKAAQGLRVAGDATEDLTDHVKVMGRAVAVGMMSWDELTQVIQRVGSTGKLTGIDFEMLTKAGYQLDQSVRNSTVTWQQLFAILDKGIPADTMGAQADTIRGKLITLNTTIRSLGATFLGIDKDTSTFIDGGLGSRMVGAIDTATNALKGLQPAAAVAGQAFALIGDGVSGLVALFQMLPGWVQTAIGAIVALVAGFGMFRQAIALVSAALTRLGLASLTALFTPLGAAIAGVALVGGLLVKSFMDQKKAAEEYKNSVVDLEQALEMLRRQGDTTLADLGTKFKTTVDGLKGQMEGFIEALYPDDAEFFGRKFEEEVGHAFDPTNYVDLQLMESTRKAYADEWQKMVQAVDDATGGLSVSTQEMTALNLKLLEAINDPNIDAEAWTRWALELLTSATNADELREAITRILDVPLSEFTRDAADGFDGLSQSMEVTKATAEDIAKIFAGLPATLDDLRIDGSGRAAADIGALGKAMERAFTTPYMASSLDFEQDAFQPLISSAIQAASLSEDAADRLKSSWDRISKAMATGDFDNARIMTDVLETLARTDIKGDAKAAEIERIATSLSTYRDSAKAMQEAQLDWLGQGENILQWWQEYDTLLNTGGAAAVRTQAAVDALNARLAEQAQFRGMVQWARDITDAGRALDQALRIFQQIDSLGSRSDAAGSIAEKLVGKPGEWAAIDDMLVAGTISLEKYNEAVQAGHAVQESNARVQELLNDVRRNQLPILAQEQAAYEASLQYLTTLSAEEQRRALMLQDSGVQAQIAAAYNTAYAASIGQIPQKVATEILVNTAQADPALAGILVDMGLLNEEFGPNGEKTFSVNFPNADATVGAINRLTIAFLEMEAAATNMSGLDLAIKIYGEDEALELYGLVKEADGTYAKMQVEATTAGKEAVDALLRDVTLADGTVVSVKTELDTSGWEDLTAAELADKFGNDPVQLPVEAVVKPMTGVSDQEWNAMLGPFPEVTIPAKLDVQGPTNPVTGVQGPLVTGLPFTGTGPQQGPAAPEVDTSAAVAALAALDAQVATTQATLVGFVAATIGVMGGWTGGIQTMLTTAGTALTTFGTTATTTQTTVQTAFTGMQTSAETGMTGVVTAVQTGMADATTAIDAEAATWPGIIDGIAGAMGAAGFNAGAAAGFGVANGIAAGKDAAVAAAQDLAGAVIAAMDAVIKPGSPSKVTTALGKTIPAGLVVGMDDGLRDVIGAGTRLADASIPPLRPSAYAYAGYGAGVSSGGGNTYIVHNHIDATGKDVDEEKIAQLAGERTLQALGHVLDDARRGNGLVRT